MPEQEGENVKEKSWSYIAFICVSIVQERRFVWCICWATLESPDPTLTAL